MVRSRRGRSGVLNPDPTVHLPFPPCKALSTVGQGLIPDGGDGGVQGSMTTDYPLVDPYPFVVSVSSPPSRMLSVSETLSVSSSLGFRSTCLPLISRLLPIPRLLPLPRTCLPRWGGEGVSVRTSTALLVCVSTLPRMFGPETFLKSRYFKNKLYFRLRHLLRKYTVCNLGLRYFTFKLFRLMTCICTFCRHVVFCVFVSIFRLLCYLLLQRLYVSRGCLVILFSVFFSF